MPIRKTSKGWRSGGRTYKTRKAALAANRAAHAKKGAKGRK